MAGIRPKRRRRTTDPKPKPKTEVVVDKGTTYVIMKISDEGRLLVPMHRERYSYDDGFTFERNGYSSMDEAELAIINHVSREESDYHNYGFEPSFYNGETSGTSKSYVIVPLCSVRVFRRLVT